MRDLKFVPKFNFVVSFLLMSIVLKAAPALANKVLIVSGGGNPANNHYSQYLQTKILADQLRSTIPGTEITVYFGAGNAEGAPLVLADVHRTLKAADGSSREVMVPGIISGNQAATGKNIDNYFSSTKTSTLRQDETFFLLVSDHGMPYQFPNGSSDSTFSNNCIDTWGFSADLASGQFKLASGSERCFSKDQLKNQIKKNVTAGRTVFAMSQCYSGGFHGLSVDLTQPMYPSADSRTCGFTAVTEDTTASGCTPDVDGQGYQGYERSFTQQLTGVDIVTGKRFAAAKNSFLDAHRAATLEDQAKDIPLSTSDYFLWKWALAIESSGFLPRTLIVNAAAAKTSLDQVAIGAKNVNDPDYISKDSFFEKMQNELVRLYPEYTTGLTGSINAHARLVAKIANDFNKIEQTIRRESSILNASEVELLKHWYTYVKTGQSVLLPEISNIETGIFGRLDEQYGVGYGNYYSLFTMSMAAVSNPAKAELVSDYKAKRESYALSWALASGDANLKYLAKSFKAAQPIVEKLSNDYNQLVNRHGQARRLLIYRQALGAWNALVKMQDAQALKELKGLIDCEATPLK
jgi:hypothetical protein